MDGILIVNKQAGITSYDVIRRLKRIFGTKKIGHAGTLDPFATGVLVIAINHGTKILRFFIDEDKEYIAKLKLGEMTDTFDLTGNVVGSNDKVIEAKEFADILRSFLGEQMQLPPMFSAKKVNGVKLYKSARKGEEIARERVKINIKDIELIEYSYPYAVIRVACSKGAYIRALANDIGTKLGALAHLTELKRTKSGQFNIEGACDLGELEAAKDDGRLSDYVITLNEAIGFAPALTVSDGALFKINKGIKILDDDLVIGDGLINRDEYELIRLVSESGELLAICNYLGTDDFGEPSGFKYLRVFLSERCQIE